MFPYGEQLKHIRREVLNLDQCFVSALDNIEHLHINYDSTIDVTSIKYDIKTEEHF